MTLNFQKSRTLVESRPSNNAVELTILQITQAENIQITLFRVISRKSSALHQRRSVKVQNNMIHTKHNTGFGDGIWTMRNESK